MNTAFVRVAGYLLGALIGWFVFVVEGAVTYLGLLVYAAVTDADLGGPLAGPMLVLLAAAAGVAAVPLVLVPAVGAGEFAARRRRWPVKGLIALGTAAALLAGYAAVLFGTTSASAGEAGIGWLLALVFAMAPMAAYASVAYGSGSIATAMARRRNPAADVPSGSG